MSTFKVILCILSLAQARRSKIQAKDVLSEEAGFAPARDASAELVDPCKKAMRKPVMVPLSSPPRPMAPRSHLDNDQINWMDCHHPDWTEKGKAEKKARAAQMDKEMAQIERTWGDTFEQTTKERNARADAMQKEKNFAKEVEWDQKKELVKAIGGAVQESFTSFCQEVASSASSAQDAVKHVMFLLIRVPNLTKQQFLEAKQSVLARWPGFKGMLINLAAYGNVDGPRAMTPERRAYLESLRERMKTLAPSDPGPRFKSVPGIRENSRRETKECAGYARTCGPDAGGLACCSLSGDCTPMSSGGSQTIHICQ